jgi:putative DNA primase/helicase
MAKNKKKLSDEPVLTEADFTAEERAAADAAASDRVVLPKGVPTAAAQEFVNRCYRKDNVVLLRHFRGYFYRWVRTHWARYSEAAVVRELYTFLGDALAVDESGNAKPYNPNKHKVLEILHALQHGTLIADERDVPFWLDENGPRSVDDLVACKNGLLNLNTFELTPHTPCFFTTGSLPIAYDPDAKEPERFWLWLEELFPGDEREYDKEAERTLQEICGYLLSSDTRQQKIFLIVGPPRAGKGTIVFLLEHMLGEDNITYQNLDSMGKEFGRWPLIDKKLVVCADARIGKGTNTHALAENLLSISGGDPQTINRKNRDFWTGRLGVRFLITTNTLPAIRDASGTIATRFILIRLTETFLGKEDPNLQPKLAAGLPGILNWALKGLRRLRKRGYFCQPTSSLEAIEMLAKLAAPVGAFVDEWCKTGPKLTHNVKDFYAAYTMWAKDVGQKPIPAHMFGKELHDVVPTLTSDKKGPRRKYFGITLSADGVDARAELEQRESERRSARG